MRNIIEDTSLGSEILTMSAVDLDSGEVDDPGIPLIPWRRPVPIQSLETKIPIVLLEREVSSISLCLSTLKSSAIFAYMCSGCHVLRYFSWSFNRKG